MRGLTVSERRRDVFALTPGRPLRPRLTCGAECQLRVVKRLRERPSSVRLCFFFLEDVRVCKGVKNTPGWFERQRGADQRNAERRRYLHLKYLHL